jgi:predicted transcriptional regulator
MNGRFQREQLVTLGVRISPALRRDLEQLAESRLLHPSALARSLLGRAIRDEQAREEGQG